MPETIFWIATASVRLCREPIFRPRSTATPVKIHGVPPRLVGDAVGMGKGFRAPRFPDQSARESSDPCLAIRHRWPASVTRPVGDAAFAQRGVSFAFTCQRESPFRSARDLSQFLGAEDLDEARCDLFRTLVAVVTDLQIANHDVS